MAFPKIGYHSILDLGYAMAITSEEAGYPLTNIYDRRLFTQWMATADVVQHFDIDATAAKETCNYFAIALHNCGGVNGHEITVLADDFTPPTTVRATVTTTEMETYPSGIWIEEFDEVEYRYWRISIAASGGGGAAAYIGEVKLGRILTFTEFLSATLDPAVEETESTLQRAEGGHVLGATMGRVKKDFTIDVGPAGADYATMFAAAEMFNDFWENHARKMYPFFFHANIAAPTYFQPLYLVAKENPRLERPPIGGLYSRRGLSFAVESAYPEIP